MLLGFLGVLTAQLIIIAQLFIIIGRIPAAA